jgi:hypothetical protein
MQEIDLGSMLKGSVPPCGAGHFVIAIPGATQFFLISPSPAIHGRA